MPDWGWVVMFFIGYLVLMRLGVAADGCADLNGQFL